MLPDASDDPPDGPPEDPPKGPPTLSAPPRIGIFDSGIGGLSVLRSVLRHLPQAHCHYIADARFTPWGDRPAAWVAARCGQLSAHLLAQHCDVVLVACNTATTQAIAALRWRWPGQPFVGIEPGIKPAAGATRNGRVAVLATPGTMRSPRLAHLVHAHARQVSVLRLPCPGLAEAIERAHADPAALARQLDAIAHTLRAADVDTVVLGCTHYPLVADALGQRLGPAVRVIDTADAVARRVASVLSMGLPQAASSVAHRATGGATPGLTSGGARQEIGPALPAATYRLPAPAACLASTGMPSALQDAAWRWLGLDLPVAHLDLPDPRPAPAARKGSRLSSPPLRG